MNKKRKSRSLNTRTKSTRLNINTQPTSCTLRTGILRTAIVFLLVLVTNVGFSQCTVFDLPDSVQNKIVKAHTDLKSCMAKSQEAGKRIVDLSLSNESLNNSNLRLEASLRKSRKWPYITLGIGGLAGIWIGSKIK